MRRHLALLLYLSLPLTVFPWLLLTKRVKGLFR